MPPKQIRQTAKVSLGGIFNRNIWLTSCQQGVLASLRPQLTSSLLLAIHPSAYRDGESLILLLENKIEAAVNLDLNRVFKHDKIFP